MTGRHRRDRTPPSYSALRTWASLAVSVIYRRVDVSAAVNVPKDRPVIFAANHGNALADIAVIVAKVPRFPRFLAAGSWWKSAPARALFRLGGVIPIHRQRDGAASARNTSTFEACHAALAMGEHLAIFPEGEMHLEPSLLPLKTGAARIALGAAADAGVAGIVIVPVGLVYDDRGRLGSDAEIRFGEPIEVDEWVEQYRADPVKAVRNVTDLLTDRLAGAIVNHGSPDEAALLDRAAAFALADLPRAEESAPRYAERNALRRALSSGLAAAGGESSTAYRELAAAVDAHAKDLSLLGVDDPHAVPPLTETPPAEQRRLGGELAVLAPPAALGMVANGPMLVVLRLGSRWVRGEAWQATAKGIGGSFLSPVVWGFEYGVLSRRIGRGRALALTTAGAVGGLASLVWNERWQQWRRNEWRDRVGRDRRAALDAAQRSRLVVRHRVVTLAGSYAAVGAEHRGGPESRPSVAR